MGDDGGVGEARGVKNSSVWVHTSWGVGRGAQWEVGGDDGDVGGVKYCSSSELQSWGGGSGAQRVDGGDEEGEWSSSSPWVVGGVVSEQTLGGEGEVPGVCMVVEVVREAMADGPTGPTKDTSRLP